MSSFTRPTMPLSRRTLIPWGWVADFVRISLTTPSVSIPDLWSCFWTTFTCDPGLISARFIMFICLPYFQWEKGTPFSFPVSREGRACLLLSCLRLHVSDDAPRRGGQALLSQIVTLVWPQTSRPYFHYATKSTYAYPWCTPKMILRHNISAYLSLDTCASFVIFLTQKTKILSLTSLFI